MNEREQMSPDADKFWENVAGKLRKKKGFCPPTAEEAEAAFKAAPSVPLSDKRINSIVDAATLEGDSADEGEWQEEMEDAAETELQLFRKTESRRRNAGNMGT